MDKKNIRQIKCKTCPYFTGIQCHGHGEYWGSCSLIKQAKNVLAKINNTTEYHIKLKKYETSWVEALDEDNNCILFEIEEWAEKEDE